MKGKTIKICYDGVYEIQETELDADGFIGLEPLQEAVGGLIDCVRIARNIDLWCNDEGKLLELKPTILMTHGDKIIDVIAGECLICAHDAEGNSIPLNDEEIKAIEQCLDVLEGYDANYNPITLFRIDL